METFLTEPDLVEHLKRIWILCCRCAQGVYGVKAPTPSYAERTARLLFMTAAQETGFTWERQRSPKFEGNVGGFGKWQTEPGSIRDSLDYLRRRPDVLSRATQFLFNDPHATDKWIDLMPLDSILWALRLDDNDKLSLLFARIHYMRVSVAIPESLEDQAGYYKYWYNTKYGAATVPGTLENYRRYWGLLEPYLKHGGPVT